MKQKKVILTLLISVCLISFNLHAESRKGLYGKKQETEEGFGQSEQSVQKNRSGESDFGDGSGPDAPGQNVPVGGGVLLLALFSAGYVVRKQSKTK